MHQRIPQQVIEVKRQAHALAGIVHVNYAASVMHDGLYVGLRTRRDPINISRKRPYLSVRLRRDGIEVFRSEEALKTFPTDFLISQLMLVK